MLYVYKILRKDMTIYLLSYILLQLLLLLIVFVWIFSS